VLRRRKRDTGILLIAIFKLVKAVALIAAGAGALKLLNPDFASRVATWLANVPLTPGQRLLALLARADAHKLEEVGIVLFAYAALFLVEGCGLLAKKHWAEWLTVVATASLIPFEVWECTRGVSAGKVATVVVNVAVVVYLAVRLKRKSA
jgi:uncharacterized membrane protein (DUF2068 family)